MQGTHLIGKGTQAENEGRNYIPLTSEIWKQIEINYALSIIRRRKQGHHKLGERAIT